MPGKEQAGGLIFIRSRMQSSRMYLRMYLKEEGVHPCTPGGQGPAVSRSRR